MIIPEKIQRICRTLLYVANGVFILVALMLIGVGLYLLLFKADLLSVLFEMDYIRVAVIIIIFCGSSLLVLSIVGLFINCFGGVRSLAVYCILMLLVVLLLLVAGVIGIIAKTNWFIDEVRQEMKDRLQQNYGIDEDTLPFNAHITRTWDTAQQWWYCCGVEDQGWGVYRQSEWYNRQPGDVGVKEYTALMVPLSCCAKSQYGHYVDKAKCQNWQLGPPNVQGGTDRNEAVFYSGCFVAGRDVLDIVSGGCIGLGIGVAILLFGGIVPAALLMVAGWSKKPALLPEQATSSRAYYAPSPHRPPSNNSYDNKALGSFDSPYVNVVT